MKVVKIALLMLFILMGTLTINADGRENGYFGGVSEGENLPKSMEQTVSYTPKATPKVYKEYLFITGKPILLEGTISITKNDQAIKTTTSGTYVEKYTVVISNVNEAATLTRNITLTVGYKVDEGQYKKQVTRTVLDKAWTEVITVGSTTYTLNATGSNYSMSTVEEVTPGITYYTSTFTSQGRFLDGDGKEYFVNNEGQVDGYFQPWSKIEKLTINQDVIRPDGNNLSVIIKPHSSAFKTLYFDKTEPFPSSIEGTYNERLERESTVEYTITAGGNALKTDQKKGTLAILLPNQIEKLAVPEGMEFIQNSWAEENFRRLYSLQVLSEYPRIGMEYEAMSRGAFVTALVKALKMDTSAYNKIDPKKTKAIFEDVPITHPMFKYIQTAYDTRLIRGVGNRSFEIDQPISRQEAFVIYIRVIGLENLGVTDAISPFTDDNQIATWAKKEIIAGFKLGIIQGDSANKVMPKKTMSKSEAAAIIDRLLIYLRQEMVDKFNQ